MCFYQSNKFLGLLHRKNFYHGGFLKSNNKIITQKIIMSVTQLQNGQNIQKLNPFCHLEILEIKYYLKVTTVCISQNIIGMSKNGF